MVRVEPSGVEIEVREGETLMAAATRAGYRWPTVCGGLAECGTCAVQIVGEPSAALAEPSALEADRLATLPDRKLHPDAEFRLACQMRPGPGTDLVVRKRGVRRAD
ncbi:MAG: (2Fe-2S)-binding protein [Actinomycetia bacterium]|nr:(2Fe-2S)-binding protein [Actinomycetes bacterium]